MNGTNRKNFGKSGRSGAVLAFACLFIMAIALAFTACEAEKADSIASEFQGTYSGFTAIGYNSVTVTVGADSITVGSKTLTGVSTSGGDSESETLFGMTASSS
jgi:hypothetical protein